MSGRARHRRTRALSVAGLACLLVSTGCTAWGDAPAADSTTLIVADSYPTTHPGSADGASFFMERATELSDGEITFDYFPSEQLGKSTDYVSLVGSQAIDIGMVSPPYLSEQLPLSNVADLPGWEADTCTTANAVNTLFAEDGVLHEQEYEPRGLRVLFAGIVPKYEIFTRDSYEVTHPDDLRGMLVRSSGGVLDQTLESLGATPVSIDGPEVYEAMARGTVDAMGLPHLSAPPYRLDEVASNATAGAPLGNFTLTFAISDAVWDELSADQKTAFRQAGAETVDHLCAAMEQETADSRDELASGGLEFTALSEDENETFQESVDPIREEWVDDMQSIGLPGDEVLTAMEQALAEQKGAR